MHLFDGTIGNGVNVGPISDLWGGGVLFDKAQSMPLVAKTQKYNRINVALLYFMLYIAGVVNGLTMVNRISISSRPPS